MSGNDESNDDKPTIVLDLNALKKQKQKQEEEIADLASSLEFNVHQDESEAISAPAPTGHKIILFDFQSDFFRKSLSLFPKGHNYHVATDLKELNVHLKEKGFQIVVFNYDVNPKAINQLCAQIKQKLPGTKTLIMAKAISPEKARAHAATASGAHGYYKFPLESQKIEAEFNKVHSQSKAA